jgi:valyl-tRNA synthetase
LWPFSTLGWPERTAELAKYYPTDTLVTGFDIIFFWVARMMMFGLHFMGDVPFRNVMMHGLVRDERGQKMSKSKGNVVDPLSLIDAYGADALRYTVASAAAPGRDAKVGAKLVETNRGFVTKIWNAARFLEINGCRPVLGFAPASARLALSRWILDAANRAVLAATAALDDYRTDEYAQICYHFVWDEVCDWFVEFAKPAFATADGDELRAVAAHVLGVVLRLLHPVMPFVTEELWDHFGYGPAGSLITAPWPVDMTVFEAAPARAEISWMVQLISGIRTVRSEMNVPPSVKSPVWLQGASAATLARVAAWGEAMSRMARASEVAPLTGEAPRHAAQLVLGETTVFLPLAGIIDLDAERARLEAARRKAAAELQKVQQKLGNAEFTSRAPDAVLDEHRERESNFSAELQRLDEALERIA